ncbi:MAG: VOC family protein [Novosphingobium sp.]|nr:VOC family protein [Novosphingobium sp.]MCP5404006.1 VOC family protein [Novosphingobium sp.]
MPDMIKREAVPAASGMLCKEHSHSAWVTNDLDKAVETFTRRYGVDDFTFIEGATPGGGQIKVAFAWAGGQILEIIQCSGPGSEFYNEMLPEGEFAIRFHHLGFVIHDEAGWKQLEQELKDGDWPIAFSTLSGDFIDAYYIKAPELGHYLEYVRPFEAGNQFYNAVPVS